MRVSCLVVTSRRSGDRNAGFSPADDADARSIVFVFIQINTFTYLRKMSIYQMNSVYVIVKLFFFFLPSTTSAVKLAFSFTLIPTSFVHLYKVSDIYDLKSAFRGPLKLSSMPCKMGFSWCVRYYRLNDLDKTTVVRHSLEWRNLM